MTRLTRIENVIKFPPLGVRAEQVKPLDLIPTPHGVASSLTKTRCSSTGVSSNGFFVSVYTPDRTPSDSKSSA